METSTSQLQQLLGRMDLTIEQPCRGVQQMFLAVRIQGYVNILFIISVLHPWYGIRWVVINNNNRLAELQSSVSIVPFLCFHFFVLSSPITITFGWSLPNLRPSSCPTHFLRFRIRFLMWILFSWSGLYFCSAMPFVWVFSSKRKCSVCCLSRDSWLPLLYEYGLFELANFHDKSILCWNRWSKSCSHASQICSKKIESLLILA